MAQIVSNNYTSEMTECLLFFGNYGSYLRKAFSHHPVQNSRGISEVNTNAGSYKMNKIFEQMKTKMSRAQMIHAEQADEHCREGMEMNLGDRVTYFSV
jgi:hypothetical protein